MCSYNWIEFFYHFKLPWYLKTATEIRLTWLDFISESHPCLWTYVCFLSVWLSGFPNRRAVTAYLEQQPTELCRWSMKNPPKPLMGVNTVRGCHKLTSLNKKCFSLTHLLPYLCGEMWPNNIILSLREIPRLSVTELQLYTCGGRRSRVVNERLSLVKGKVLDYWCLWAPLLGSFLDVSLGKRCAHSPLTWVTAPYELSFLFPPADTAASDQRPCILIRRRARSERQGEDKEMCLCGFLMCLWERALLWWMILRCRNKDQKEGSGSEAGWEERRGLVRWKSIIKRSCGKTEGKRGKVLLSE